MNESLELINYLKYYFKSSNHIISKGVEELSYLKKWLQQEHAKSIQLPIEEYIKALIESCSHCTINQPKKYPFGSGKNGLMIILHAPSLINKMELNLFKDDSISLLKKMVNAMNLSFNECYITNLLKCEIDYGLPSAHEVILDCEYIIEEEINVIKPKVVIVMGEIKPLQSIVKNSTSIFWYNTEHPVTLIKSPDFKKNAWATLQLVMKKLMEFN